MVALNALDGSFKTGVCKSRTLYSQVKLVGLYSSKVQFHSSHFYCARKGTQPFNEPG